MTASDIAEQALEVIHWIKEQHKAPDWILRTEELFKSVETEYVDITPALRSITAEAKRGEAEACAQLCERLAEKSQTLRAAAFTSAAEAIRERWNNE